ncbi:MAG TPA: APC family permease [Saprospiraceae bacterium]|nr:APC family permease [Saprospiraceae bacterium]
MNNKIGLKEAMSIGIGGMVGGGIFAVLGLAVSYAKGGTPIAFLFAGIVALITGYSYSKMSLKYPDRGGTVKFINQGFGINVFSGAMNNFLWVSYIIMLSLYASAFGSYAPNLLKILGGKVDFHLYVSLVIIVATFVNYYSIQMVGKIESIVVAIKLIILISFVFIGGYGLFGNNHLDQLEISYWTHPIELISGAMVIFVAYEGFELIANAAPDIENPQSNIPKAYFYSIIFVIILYISISIVTVGSLAFSEIAKAQDYVLAEAAKPMLGQAGFVIITIAALLSTFSAINATLYGGSRVNYEIAKDRELPKNFTSMLWNQPIGLFITFISTLLMANLVDLTNISIAGSIGFLLVFALVNLACFKLSEELNSNKLLTMAGFLLCMIALAVLIISQFSSQKIGVFMALGIIVFCVFAEWIYIKKSRNLGFG